MPAFRLRRKKKLPGRATHFRLVSALVYIDIGKRTFKREVAVSDYHIIGNKHCEAFATEHRLEEHANHAAFWLWGIEYYEWGKKGWEGRKGRIDAYDEVLEL